MRGYEREDGPSTSENGYDDYYEEDSYGEEEDEGEEYETEQDPRSAQEESEYLELRRRLKEQIRNKNKTVVGSALNKGNDRKRKLPYNNNYGSFFGPSKPVISQRVIQESKSFLETQHLTPKVLYPQQPPKRSAGSSTTGSKPVVQNKKPRLVNEVRNKVQKIKDTRDYSFLLSDDVNIPAPAKVAPQSRVPTPTSEARSAQAPIKHRQGLVKDAGKVNGSHGEKERKPVPTSMNGQMHHRADKFSSASRPKLAHEDSRRPHSSSNGNGPRSGPSLSSKGVSSSARASIERKAPVSVARSSQPVMQKSVSLNSQPSSRSQPSSKYQSSSRPQPSSKYQPTSKPQPSLKPLPSSKSQSLSKPQPRREHLDSRREHMEPRREHMEPRRERMDSRREHMEPRREHMDSRRERLGPAKANSLPKQSLGRSRDSRPQVNHKPQRPNHAAPDNRPSKKMRRRYSDDDEDEAAFSMLRQMFRYNPNKFADRDDEDLSDMEANFDEILREEKRSEIIGKKEDEEQRLLIEAEERAERLAKMRRLNKR